LTGLASNKFLIKNLFQQFFKMKTFTLRSSQNVLLFFFDVFNWVTPGKHNQLPTIIWNFYYDAMKLLQEDICIIITSN